MSTLTSKEAIRHHLEANYDMLIADGLSRYVIDSDTGRIVGCNMTHDKGREYVETEGFDDFAEVLGELEIPIHEVIDKVWIS